MVFAVFLQKMVLHLTAFFRIRAVVGSDCAVMGHPKGFKKTQIIIQDTECNKW